MPLFLASFAGFFAAWPAISSIPKMRSLAVREARQEYGEYYFLFPLFLSISLLTTAGFFEGMSGCFIRVSELSERPMWRSRSSSDRPFSPPSSITTSSPTSPRALLGFDVKTLHLLRWRRSPATPSVVAGRTSAARNQSWPMHSSSATWTRHFRPVQWIREMTPVIIKILVVMAAIIYSESAILNLL